MSCHLKVFLTSLLVSIAWYYYNTSWFIVFLNQLLLGAALVFPIVALAQLVLRRRSGRALWPDQTMRRATLRSFAFWNIVLFFALLLVAETQSFCHFQTTQADYVQAQLLFSGSFVIIVLATLVIAPRRFHAVLHLPLALFSFFVAYEIVLTRTAPSLNQASVLGPVMSGPFISYNGGNGRLINDHYGIPQRRHLIAVVPGIGPFRPAGQGGVTARDRVTLATPVLAPADGEIISVSDLLPELPPHTIDPAYPAGNHLCLRIAPNRYLYLANLQQHSVTVRPGDQVTRGQPIARIGKNGSFTEAALVMLLVDDPNVILPATRSIPFYFDGVTNAPQLPRRNAVMHPRRSGL